MLKRKPKWKPTTYQQLMPLRTFVFSCSWLQWASKAEDLFLFPRPSYCLSIHVELVALQSHTVKMTGCACHLGKGDAGEMGGERGSQCYQGSCFFPVLLPFALESWTPEQTSALLSSSAPHSGLAKARGFVCLPLPIIPLVRR